MWRILRYLPGKTESEPAEQGLDVLNLFSSFIQSAGSSRDHSFSHCHILWDSFDMLMSSPTFIRLTFAVNSFFHWFVGTDTRWLTICHLQSLEKQFETNLKETGRTEAVAMPGRDQAGHRDSNLEEVKGVGRRNGGTPRDWVVETLAKRTQPMAAGAGSQLVLVRCSACTGAACCRSQQEQGFWSVAWSRQMEHG